MIGQQPALRACSGVLGVSAVLARAAGPARRARSEPLAETELQPAGFLVEPAAPTASYEVGAAPRLFAETLPLAGDRLDLDAAEVRRNVPLHIPLACGMGASGKWKSKLRNVDICGL